MEHEADDEHHEDTGDDIAVVLNDELVAQVRYVLGGTWASFECATHFQLMQIVFLLNLYFKNI